MNTFISFLVSSILLIIVGLATSQCSEPAEVSADNVSSIVKTLSSDEMKGRSALAEEATRAANFIAGEFDEIGLSYFKDLEDYHQPFEINIIKQAESSITVNGKNISEKNYFASIYTRQLNWNNSDIEPSFISQESNLKEQIQNYLNDNSSSLIFVDEAHETWFSRYRNYFSRPNQTLDLSSRKNDVFILYSGNISSFNIQFENEIESKKLANVIGVIEGNRAEEKVIFSAHYDHLGVTTAVEGDSIANGANDNASGVAAVIELARYFKAAPTPERTLLFVAFSAEEIGGFGVKYFSKQLNPDDIIAMCNIEMIGKPAVNNSNSAWITGYEYSDFGEIFSESMEDSSFIFYADPYPNQNLFFRSDNATLARLGVPAHTISTTPIDIDEDYHKVTDEYETLDMHHITRTITAISQASEKIVNGEATPTRINL